MTISDDVLRDKVAVISGAGTGLGKLITRQLVAAGTQVAILGRNPATLQKLVDELGPSVLAVPTDVSDPDQVRAAFKMIDSTFGGVDILINNAAIYAPFTIDEASDTQLQSIMGTNFLGAAYCMREAVRQMKRKGQGDIINVSSESARNPFPYLTVYAASKSALETLSTGQRMELAADGIRVMILRSGTMIGEDTNTSMGSWTSEQLDQAMATWQQTGHRAFGGKGMDPATVATAAINALRLPREATVDLIEIRSAQ